MIRWALPALVVVVVGVGASMAASAATRSSSGTVRAVMTAKFGMVLVGPSGKTLYRYTLDAKGVNKCTPVAACARYWPRFLVKSGAKPAAGAGTSAGLLGTIKQPKGLVQVTYAGFPLYYFVGDAKAGDTKGEGFQNTWYVVNPKGALVKHAAASSNAGAASNTSSPATTTTGSTWG
jgi:predicted lipoprotein with Yx(FWY)xxD motif